MTDMNSLISGMMEPNDEQYEQQTQQNVNNNTNNNTNTTNNIGLNGFNGPSQRANFSQLQKQRVIDVNRKSQNKYQQPQIKLQNPTKIYASQKQQQISRQPMIEQINSPFDNPDINYRTINYVQPWSNQYKDFVASYIKQNTKSDPVLLQFQFKRQLKQKFFSQKAIQQKMKIVTARFIYYPSRKLVQAINIFYNYKPNYQDIIFNSIAFKNGALINLINNNVLQRQLIADIQSQILHIGKYVRNWGRYQIDIQKLNQYSHKQKTATYIKYSIDQYDLSFQFQQGLQTMTLRYKNKIINPQQFKQNVIRQISIFLLKKQAIQLYAGFMYRKQSFGQINDMKMQQE